MPTMEATSDPYSARLDAAIAHHQAGRLGEAQQAYRAILAQDPGEPRALHLLGIMAGQCGDNAAAAELLERATARDPRNPRLWHSLGQAQRHRAAFPAALKAFGRAVELDRDFLEAYADCAEAAREEAARAVKAGRGKAAQELRRLAAHYLSGLGSALWDRQRFRDAEAPLRDAVALDPKNADAFNTLGAVLRDIGRLGDAEAAFRRSLALAPGAAEAWNNLGNVLADQGATEAAEAAYRKALALRPGFYAAEQNLTRWMLYRLCYRADLDADALFEAHRAWGEGRAAAVPAAAAPGFANPPDPGRVLRVGFVSPDLRQHSVAYFLAPLLAALDAAEIESFCYAEVARPDATSERLRRLARGWRTTVGLDDRALARQVREDGIDILIDLAGHTANSRLTAFSPKPAPVTVTWLGYPATTGLPAIDWRLTDAIADPPGAADRRHTERLLRLPHGFLCYEAPADAPAVAPLPAAARGHVTFGSFNNLAKVTPSVVALWAEILRGLPGSRLLLKDKTLIDKAVRRRLLDLFRAGGVAAERLELLPRVVDTAGHLGAYGAMDVALDPFPYNGTTTSCEALWMGVPVVTLKGDRHAGRVGASLLERVGLAELVAETPADYVARSLALARDLDRLARLRQGLRARLAASPLCDAAGFARDFTAALRQIWREWCADPRRAGAVSPGVSPGAPSGAESSGIQLDGVGSHH